MRLPDLAGRLALDPGQVGERLPHSRPDRGLGDVVRSAASSSSRPSAPSCMTQTAVNVFVIEPIR